MIVTYEYDPKNPPPLMEDQIKMLDELEKMDDSEIDLSDIPEITEEQFKRRITESAPKGGTSPSGQPCHPRTVRNTAKQ